MFQHFDTLVIHEKEKTHLKRNFIQYNSLDTREQNNTRPSDNTVNKQLRYDRDTRTGVHPVACRAIAPCQVHPGCVGEGREGSRGGET